MPVQEPMNNGVRKPDVTQLESETTAQAFAEIFESSLPACSVLEHGNIDEACVHMNEAFSTAAQAVLSSSAIARQEP